jgi:hypothetical protein
VDGVELHDTPGVDEGVDEAGFHAHDRTEGGCRSDRSEMNEQ